MKIVSNCRNCGAPLSRTSIEAFVPYCDSCGSPFMGVGGSLGVTSAFERDDPGLNRQLVESQIRTLNEAIHKYNGMIAHCKELLARGVEAYASVPSPPALLAVQPVPSMLSGVFVPAIRFGFLPGCPIAVFWLFLVLSIIARSNAALGVLLTKHFGQELTLLVRLVWYAFPLAVLAVASAKLWERAKIIRANGTRPQENARRIHSHKEAALAALRAATPEKDAADHKLRRQIVEIEGQLAGAESKRGELQARLKTL
jgi:hypothetical protein